MLNILSSLADSYRQGMKGIPDPERGQTAITLGAARGMTYAAQLPIPKGLNGIIAIGTASASSTRSGLMPCQRQVIPALRTAAPN